MNIEKVTIVFVSLILMIFLSIKYIKRKNKENLVIVSFNSLFTSLYITFAIYDIYIPIILQISIFLFSILIPTIFVSLQYNNIILSRQILYYMMKFYYNTKDYKKTIRIIEKLANIDGSNTKYLYILGKCCKGLGDYINARDYFSLAVEYDKNDYKSYFELGLVFDETNKKDTAIVMYNSALSIKQDFYEAGEALAICLTSKGKFEYAVSVYKKMVKFHPNSFEMYYNIGMIESELGNYDSAVEAFKKSGSIKPDLYMAHFNLGKLYSMRGKYDMAIEQYTKILNSTNYGPIGYYNLAIMYAKKEDYQRAMTSLEYAMELDERYIKESDTEYSFNHIRPMIEDYKKAKEKEKIANIQKHNFMSQRLRIFKLKEQLEEEETENNIESEVLLKNHA